MEKLLPGAFPGEHVVGWVRPTAPLDELRGLGMENPSLGFHPESDGGLYVTEPCTCSDEVLILIPTHDDPDED